MLYQIYMSYNVYIIVFFRIKYNMNLVKNEDMLDNLINPEKPFRTYYYIVMGFVCMNMIFYFLYFISRIKMVFCRKPTTIAYNSSS